MIDLGEYLVKIQRYSDKRQHKVTVANIYNKEHHLLGIGQVACSTKDCYNKKIGRKLAIKNALANTIIAKKDRAKLWENYRVLMTKHPRW